MLFYLSYMWGWIKIFGRSEVALRAANIPFFLLLVGSAAWASRRLLQRPYLWVLFCLSPFVWFYLNEARPYAAVTASIHGGTGFTPGVHFAPSGICFLGSVVLPDRFALCVWRAMSGSVSHPLDDTVGRGRECQNRFPLPAHGFYVTGRCPVLCCLPAFLVLGGFYAWTSSQGVHKTIGNPSIVNLAVVAYEFMGFEGLGPPRNELRGGIQLRRDRQLLVLDLTGLHHCWS